MAADVSARADKALLGVASCFEPTPQSPRRASWEAPALLVIVLLAAVVRFWGVGSWGLEYDEETMAMPTMHIVRYGTPVLPSGMTYVRGIGQLYMMAASVKAFGESEWALRFPSVLCGLLLVVLAFQLGRRFLRPIANMGLTVAVAFLPGFIADSQEARMYIFMVTSLAAYAVLIFKWEATSAPRYLLGAVLVMIVGLQFHLLTVFGALFVFFPGLLKADRAKLWQGLGAFALILVSYFAINKWVESFYPPGPATHGLAVALQEFLTRVRGVRLPPWALLATAAVGLALSVHLARAGRSVVERVLLGVAVFIGLAAQLAFWNHLGLLLLIGVAVYLLRERTATLAGLSPLAVLSGAILAFEYHDLSLVGIVGSRKIIGAMVGLPSIWPTLRMAQYSPVAAVIVLFGTARAIWHVSQGRRIADYWLFLFLAAWVPLFLLGLFSWDVEKRYTEFALLPLLVCAFASFQEVGAGPLTRFLVAAAICALVVNPLASARVINAGYSIHPDHKGAAQFIRATPLWPGDLLLAEDVLQQTYYLGHVDYWLIGPDTAEQFSRRRSGELRDIYTATPVISSVEQLNALLLRPDRGAIYIIGSGEQQEDGRRGARGVGLDDALHSPLWEVVYSGRDGLTKVWKAKPRQRTPLSSSER